MVDELPDVRIALELLQDGRLTFQANLRRAFEYGTLVCQCATARL